MEYGRLGSSGLLVSKIGLGTNNFGGRIDLDRSRAVIERALELGITFFDTADAYGMGKSEEYIGQVLGNRRKEVMIATKFGSAMGESPYTRGSSRRYIIAAAEASLRRLNTHYIDLYQAHWIDPQTPIDETLQALDDLVHQGKVRYIGECNFGAWQIVDTHWTSRMEHLTRPISAQHEYSLLNREIQKEVLPAARAMGMGILPYYPLAGGFLTGKYRRNAPMPEGARLTLMPANRSSRFVNDRNFEHLEKLEKFAEERGHSVTELAFAWLLAQPEVASVIAGATHPDQVDANVAAGAWKLSREEFEAVP